MARLLLLAALLLAAPLRPAHAQPPAAPPAEAATAPDPASALAGAVRLQQTGDFAGAAAAYERVLGLGVDDPALRSNLGAAYSALGRYDDAIEQYRLALARDATNVAIRRNLAIAFHKTGRFEDAAAAAEAVVNAQPANDPARLLLADCLFRLGRNARVVEVLQPLAARPEPDRAVSYLLGMALAAEGRWDDAQAVLDRVLRDDAPEAHVFLAMMYLRDEDCEQALPEIRLALAAGGRVPLANFLNGQCLMDEKRSDWEGAIAAFRAELAIDPNHFESNLYLGDLLRQGARHEESLSYLERALRLRPGNLGASFSLGAAYVALGRTAEALPLLEAVAKDSPDHVQTQMQLAVAYHRLGRSEDSAHAKAAVGRLSSEGENRFFQGVSQALGRLLGKAPAEAAGAGPAGPNP